MFHGREASAKPMRRLAAWIVVLSACRLGEHIAEPPIDGAGTGGDDAAGDAAIDADVGPHGLHAMIGQRPEVTGSCNALDDHTEMVGRFEPPMQAQDVTAGWDFDTDADSYMDPSYGFDPAWPTAQSGRFSLRFHGHIALDAGHHCFSIDIGATGTDIVNGKNACGQIWLAAGTTAAAETGYDAATSGPATGCIDVAAPASIELDLVFWYFNVLERARLHVRHCAGAGCTPDQPLSAMTMTPT